MAGNDKNTTSVTVVPNPKLEVGYNYPWAWDKYGVYFGSGDKAPRDQPLYNQWTANLRQNLNVLKNELGIRTVRMFMFCNLNNFGTVVRNTLRSPGEWNFTPPSSLDSIYTSQFTEMLEAFANLEMNLIPSLLDFGAVASGRGGSGFRNEIAMFPDKGRAFLDMAFEPLLAISKNFSTTVPTWEVMNEPSNVVPLFDSVNVFVDAHTDTPIAVDSMRTLLADAVQRIQNATLSATVGHRFFKDQSRLPFGTVRQFHYYPLNLPDSVVENRLPTFLETGSSFIGEFASSKLAPTQYSQIWPEIPAAEQDDTKTRVLARLRHIESRGYRLACIWPDGNAPFDYSNPATEGLKISQGVQDAIKAWNG
jgi:hypothetical protein